MKDTNTKFKKPNVSDFNKQAGGSPLGVSGVMKAYQMKEKFSGSFDGDLPGALEVYDTICIVCHLTGAEKAEVLPVILKDEFLSFYMSYYKEGQSYEEASQLFIENYMSVEQGNRGLMEWQYMRFSSIMREHKDRSEFDVFRLFCKRLLQIQRQLDPV